MNLSRLIIVIAAGCCLLRSPSLRADDDISALLGPNRQFNATVVVTTADGTAMTQKVYGDSGKTRLEMSANGMNVVSIVRPDEKKMYSIVVAQKMVMEMPLDPEQIKRSQEGMAPQGKSQLVGPDTVDGVAATKYKLTSDDGKTYWLWIDSAKKAPIKMAATDGSVTVAWKDYQSGPQDAALFEPPADYKVMQMPGGMPGAPGGGGAPPSAPGGDGGP